MGRGATTILVVEDESLLLFHAVGILEEAGFHVLTATNADEAIELLRTRSEIRLVFTDIDMPGSMNGLRLAKAIRERWPPVEVIVTSGHMKVSEQDLPSRGMFFEKPYSDDALVGAVRTLLG